MINIAIVEDDRNITAQLQAYLQKMSKEKDIEFFVTAYDDALDLLDAYKSQFDIVLMDIELPTMNGMDAAARVRAVDDDIIIIFVTYMAQFAVRGYEVRAFDFIVKPLQYFPFAAKIYNAAKETLHRRENSILVKTSDGIERLVVSKIKYIEISGHMMRIHMTDRMVELRCSMTEMEEKLRPYHFLRSNVCYLLNPRFIDKISESQVIIGGTGLPISRPKKKDFLRELAAYFSEHRG